jgi:uncharacterized protein (TIGR00266 family)
MQVDIQAGPSFSYGVIDIAPGDAIKVEAGAMAAMGPGVDIETKAQGGLLGGLKRSVLGGESFFINTFRAPQGGEVAVAAKLPGDMMKRTLDGTGAIMVQSGSWLASDDEVAVDTKWGGAKTFFSGEGLFLLRCSGKGDVLVSTYGAIVERDLGAGEAYSVDTGHIVAFDEGIGYEVTKTGGWKSTILGGEGLVAKLTGPGKIWMQTRSEQDLIGWLTATLPFSRS